MPPQPPAKPLQSQTTHAPTSTPSLDEIAALTQQRTYNAARFAPKDEQSLERLAERWYDSDLLPSSYYPAWKDEQNRPIKYSPEDLTWYRNRGISRAVIVMRFGAALGVLPEMAIRQIYVIEGLPCPAAAMLAGLALASPVCTLFEVVETSVKKCAIRVQRRGMPPMLVEALYDEYKHLHNKTNWKNYPADMVYARAVGRACRRAFPDLYAGIYCAEERVDVRTERAAGRTQEDVLESILSMADEPVIPRPQERGPSAPPEHLPTEPTPPTGSDSIEPPVDVEQRLRAELAAATTVEQCASLQSQASKIEDEGLRKGFARDAAAKRVELGKGAS
jgi:hypothetical protein